MFRGTLLFKMRFCTSHISEHPYKVNTSYSYKCIYIIDSRLNKFEVKYMRNVKYDGSTY